MHLLLIRQVSELFFLLPIEVEGIKNKTVAGVILLVLLATYGYPLLFQSKTLYSLEGNPWLDKGAAHWQDAATAKIVHDTVAGGELPLWSPRTGLGMNLFSDPHAAFFSPLRLVLYAAPGTYGWDVFTLLRVALLILFTFWLLRRLQVVPWVALTTAVLFGYSGHVFYFLNFVHLNTLVFVPLFLEGLVAVLHGERRAGLPRLAAGVPLMLFGGGLVDVLLVGILCVLVLAAFVAERLAVGDKNILIARLRTLAGHLALGGLVAMPFLLPYLETRTLSIDPYPGRSAGTFNQQLHFVAMFFSKLYVPPADASHYYMGYRQYLHLIALPGFVLAFFLLGRGSPNAFFLRGLIAFFLFYYLKLYDFGFMSFINDVPLLKDIRFEKYHGVLHLAVYTASAMAVSELIRHRRVLDAVVFLAAACSAAVAPIVYALLVHGQLETQAVLYAAIMAAVVGIYFAWRYIVPSYRWGVPAVCASLVLIAAAQIHLDFGGPFAQRQPNFPDESVYRAAARLDGNDRVFPLTGDMPRIWAAHGVRDVRDYTDVQVKRYFDFFKKHVENGSCWHFMLLCAAEPDKIDLRLARWLGVRYLVVNQTQLEQLETGSDERHRVAERHAPYTIVELDDPAPVIALYGRARVDEPERIRRTIVAGQGGLDGTTWVERDIGFAGSDEPVEFDVTDLDWRTNSLTAYITTDHDAVAVIRQSYFPGWRAYIDDEAVEIFRANYLFQGVVVPAGSHTLRLVYRPLSLYAGLALFVLGIAATLVVYRRSGQTDG